MTRPRRLTLLLTAGWLGLVVFVEAQQSTANLSQANKELLATDADGGKILARRLKGIQMLASLAEASDANSHLILERLVAYVRVNGARAKGSSDSSMIAEDLQSALDVIARIVKPLEQGHSIDLSGLDLAKARLSGGTLLGVNLSASILEGSSLSGLDLRSANLEGADFRNAVLDKVDLRDARMARSSLQSAELMGVNLYQAVLSQANLRAAKLIGANLYAADLRAADLRGADLSGTDLRKTDLSNADLREADLTGAVLQGAVLDGANLRSARGLEPGQVKSIHSASGTLWPEVLAVHGNWEKPLIVTSRESVTKGSSGREDQGADASSRSWSGFRGPNRDGRYRGKPIALRWPPEGPPELWRIQIGGGYASTAITEERVYTIEQRGENEVVACYDLRTGKEIWSHDWRNFFQVSVGGDGTVAGGPRTTPTWDEGKIYALGARGEFRCLEGETGKLIWSRNILNDSGAINVEWGMAASPLIVGQAVIVQPGGAHGRSVVAYDKVSGEPLWSSLDDKTAYVSPMWVRIAGRPQILTLTASRVVGLTVEDGSLLWEYPWVTPSDVNASQPVVIDSEHVFVSSGYGHGAVLLKIQEGNVPLAVKKVWENILMKNKFNSSVLHEGYIYGFDEQILACLDASTGVRKWKGGRYGYGQLLLTQGHLIVLTEDGEVVLVRASPDSHQELARFRAIQGRTWNHPALQDGLLIVRNEREMVCYDLSKLAIAYREPRKTELRRTSYFTNRTRTQPLPAKDTLPSR